MDQPPEKPRYEPEILPPERADEQRASDEFRLNGVHRITIGRVGPVGIGLLVLAIGLAAASAAILLLGLFLILIPVAGLLVAIALIGALVRKHLRPPE
jgi:hypothetical protein